MTSTRFAIALGVSLLTGAAGAQDPGEAPALGTRITQQMVESQLSLKEIRTEGRRVFSTPFNTLDGLGDGPFNPALPIIPGNRPPLTGPGGEELMGPFTRIFGLDSQSCTDCHNILQASAVPPTFLTGGTGGIVAVPIFTTTLSFDEQVTGRISNSLPLWGAGGVELLGKEMTSDLQALKAQAQAIPDTVVPLVTKGVDFGSIVFTGGSFDTSDVTGVATELVVRPFGRKGDFPTVRALSSGAFLFHHGIQPVELFGEGTDFDGDGVVNELTIGEGSAMHIWAGALRPPERPRRLSGDATQGAQLFQQVGCADCHIPELVTDSRILTFSFPEQATAPGNNVYQSIDLSRPPTRFRRSGDGVRVALYSDLKRHDMGPDLAEPVGGANASGFITARLWDVADTAPYLHDGRAVTLSEAILLHGGEAQAARDAFAALQDAKKAQILAFLRTLLAPKKVDRDLQPRRR